MCDHSREIIWITCTKSKLCRNFRYRKAWTWKWQNRIRTWFVPRSRFNPYYVHYFWKHDFNMNAELAKWGYWFNLYLHFYPTVACSYVEVSVLQCSPHGIWCYSYLKDNLKYLFVNNKNFSEVPQSSWNINEYQ